MPRTRHETATSWNPSPSSDTLSPNQTRRKSRPASGASSGSRRARAVGRATTSGVHSSEIRTPSPASSTSTIGPLMPASIASRIRSEVASEMPGTWVIAARPSDSGMRRLMTVRPASVTSTRSVWAGVSPRPPLTGGAGSGRTTAALGRSVERVEDRPGLLGRQPALGDQPQDAVEGVVSHPPAVR